MTKAWHPWLQPRVPGLKVFGLWLVVSFQLAIPGGYYFWRDETDDERFAWRMFSSLRFRVCRVEASEVGPAGRVPIALQHALHASWISSLRRGRRAVIERFLARRCAQGGLTGAWLLRSCTEVDGARLPPELFALDCTTGKLTRSAERMP